jgi:hypothetical protein
MENIPANQASAFNRIDQSAERARLRHITGGIGQALVYQEKAEQAVDYITAGYPSDLSSYPYLQAEAIATSKDSKQIADDILAERSKWIAVGADIEAERLRGKKNVREATDIDSITFARDAAIAALDAL